MVDKLVVVREIRLLRKGYIILQVHKIVVKLLIHLESDHYTAKCRTNRPVIRHEQEQPPTQNELSSSGG